MSQHVYKTIELTGSSTTSSDDAVRTAIEKAAKSVRGMRWFEVVECRGHIERDRREGVRGDDVHHGEKNRHRRIGLAGGPFLDLGGRAAQEAGQHFGAARDLHRPGQRARIDVFSASHACVEESGGQGRNRTTDTRILSPLL